MTPDRFLATPVALASGSRVGPYELLSIVGAGGMGVVYRARDTRLKRDVALKVLPGAFGLDPDRVARFQREAELLATLNHQHIAAIYGLEESDGVRALVLELVEGPTLADRIAQGAIPLDESLIIARQIVEALEAAHEQGIIHRDLKPANIKVRPDGTVKVLDFGLAKLSDTGSGTTSSGPAGAAPLSISPTITSPAMTTGVGVLLGTAAYMSPEQAKGKPADKRCDIWAFGCVLFEMLTGKCAFEGDDVGDTLAAILKGQPSWDEIPASTPPSIRRLLKRTLEKDRRRRLADIADARLELDEGDRPPEGTVEADRSSWQRARHWVLAFLLPLAVAGVAVVVWTGRVAIPPPETRVEITTPATMNATSVAISPDGRNLVFVGDAEGGPRLWLRSLNSDSARPLAGTEDAAYPFWSPNGRSIGFFADFQLKRIDIDSGLVQSLARAAAGVGGTWNTDGVIVFAPTKIGSLVSVSAQGGTPIALTRLQAPKQVGHRFPRFLPDGQHFLFYVVGSADVRGIYVGQTSSDQTARLVDADSAGTYTVGHLLFVRQNKLFAQAFDPVTLSLSGEMRSIGEHVAIDSSAYAALSASEGGSIVYRQGTGAARRQFVWVDRSGNEHGRVGELDSGNPSSPSMSHDAHQMALGRAVNGNGSVWLMDTTKGSMSPWSTNSIANYPVWSPDGRSIVFQVIRNGTGDLHQRSIDGKEDEAEVLATPEIKVPFDWSPDGRFLLYGSLDATTGGYSLSVLPMQGQRTPTQLLKPEVNARYAQFSPDGKWIAYQSNLTGRWDVFVQPFPGSTGRTLVSIAGGAQVRWRPDGKELFFIGLDGRLMAVPIRTGSSGEIEAGSPSPLFATHIGGAVQGIIRQQYTVAPDGQRFLMNTTEDTETRPLTLVLNWTGAP
jgi:eukaryotic-like serine/threonine-protein kinase